MASDEAMNQAIEWVRTMRESAAQWTPSEDERQAEAERLVERFFEAELSDALWTTRHALDMTSDGIAKRCGVEVLELAVAIASGSSEARGPRRFSG